MTVSIKIIMLHLAYFGTGALALDHFFPQKRKVDSLRVPLAYFTGIFVNVVALQLAVVLGITSNVLPTALFLLGLAGFIIHSKKEIAVVRSRFPSIRFESHHFIYSLVAVVAAPAVALIAIRMLSTPEFRFDTTAFWLLKAKYFFYGNDLWSDAFQNMDRLHPHRDYPLYVPLLWYQHFAVIGMPDDHLLKFGVFIYHGFGCMLFFLLIKDWAGTFVSLLVLAILLLSPLHGYSTLYDFHSINGSISSLYVGFSLSIAMMASLGFFLRFICNERRSDLFGAVMFLSTAVLMKREGIVWFGLFSLIFLISIHIYIPEKRKEAYAFYLLPLAVFIGWWLLKAKLPEEYSEFHLPRSLDEVIILPQFFPRMLKAWFERLINIHIWGVIGIMTVAGFCLGFIRNRHRYKNLILCLLPIGYLCCIFLVVILYASQDQNHVDPWHHITGRDNCVFNRLLIHIHLTALFLAVVINSDKFIQIKLSNKK